MENLNSTADESEYLSYWMHKLWVDVHETPSILVDRASFYAKTNFLEVVSRYCRIVSIEWDGRTVRIQFKSPDEAIAYGIPEIVNIKRKFEERPCYWITSLGYSRTINVRKCWNIWKVLNAVLERIFYWSRQIRSENLKLIVQSEHLIQLLRERSDPDNPIFTACLWEIFHLLMNHFTFNRNSRTLWFPLFCFDVLQIRKINF